MGDHVLDTSDRRATLSSLTRQRVGELQTRLDSMLSQWIFMGKGSGLELFRVDGSCIRYAETRFHGEPESVYWEPWLEEHVVKESQALLSTVAAHAHESGACVVDSLTEAADQLCAMVTTLYDRKAEVAALLSGDGVNPGELRDVSATIETMQTTIRQQADTTLAESRIMNSWLLSGTTTKGFRRRIAAIWERIRRHE